MTTTTTMTPEMSALKTRLKTTWESGDYGVFAKYLEKGALEFFERLNIPPGTRLLDVACGAGQLTLPAARKGIQVTGLDLAAKTAVSQQGIYIFMAGKTPMPILFPFEHRNGFADAVIVRVRVSIELRLTRVELH